MICFSVIGRLNWIKGRPGASTPGLWCQRHSTKTPENLSHADVGGDSRRDPHHPSSSCPSLLNTLARNEI